ncbi:DNA adenine methylase [Alteromonas sp. KUL49]|uniref:DNA adenine methylase n=1 Tax=Alteromonas sp. KUL49 TaxID=2480798 RepID=UPI00102F14A9|nr:DNA adenine methylase [Alteromonas sp. KUL49]TAP33076.1 DNA adenine methylase [Alteromonas sp. KUL49]GEA13747.1 restriction endonuclease subunit M [Alteromonas sp. KUL49]
MPVKPVIPWIGGKTKLLKHLLPLVPEHRTYVEPFCGGAAMLFAKEQSKVEVINDINGDLINLYRVVQNHLEEFVRLFKYALASRQVYEWEQLKAPETLTDIQRAARFFYLQKNSFGAKIEGQSFGVSKVSPPRFNILRIEETLSEAHLRLARVLIENICWKRCIEKYDSEESFIFCDPPYWQTEGYGVDFGWDNYEALLGNFKECRGKMLITLNDHPEIRTLFKGYVVDTKDIKYTVSGNKTPKLSKEVFIANYE